MQTSINLNQYFEMFAHMLVNIFRNDIIIFFNGRLQNS